MYLYLLYPTNELIKIYNQDQVEIRRLMDDQLNNMVKILLKNKDYGQVAIKAEFEAEGTTSKELLKLKELSRIVELPLVIKIGGCEAIRDLYECQELGIGKVVAPMIESQYAAHKYIKALDRVYLNDQNKPKSFINVETKSGFKKIKEICTEISQNLNGIVLGRVDYVGSLGLSRDVINSERILNDALSISKECLDNNLDFVIGGGISQKAIPFLKKIQQVKLDNFETRKCVFDSKILNESFLEKALKNSVEFELLWLKNKKNFLKEFSYEDKLRIKMLEERVALK